MLRESTKNVCPLIAILKNKRTLFKQEWKKTFILHVAQILGKKSCWLIILRDLNSPNIMNLFMEKIKPIKAYCN